SLGIELSALLPGAALLAPWLYWTTQSVAQSSPHHANSPFHRFVNRSSLGLALIGLWPLLRSLGVASGRDIGLVGPARQWKKLGGGLALGFVSLAIVAMAALAAGSAALAEHLSPVHTGPRLAGAAAPALLV